MAGLVCQMVGGRSNLRQRLIIAYQPRKSVGSSVQLHKGYDEIQEYTDDAIKKSTVVVHMLTTKLLKVLAENKAKEGVVTSSDL